MQEDQSALIEWLEQPETHGVAGPVTRIDTHAAVVFLAGDRAYKLKRPIRLSYLDYSSIEQRHAGCLTELRVNRRAAPSLYLDVVPVTAEDGGFALGGEGEPIDWLVVMRRFPQENLFSNLADTGALYRSLTIRLADRIADYHDSAPIRPEYGGRDGLSFVIESNDVSMRENSGGLLPRKEAAALSDASRAALGDLGPLLEARRAAGRVRRCHGDLHLANLCLLNGRPTLFDAIEFSERIGSIDLLYDLAFLVMDMEHRGLRPLANLVLGRYLAMTEDHYGLPALPLFLSVRAAVRCHVSALAAARQSGPEKRERKAAEALAYLALARHCLETRPATLIAVGGLSGTGKTTLARSLAPRYGAVPGALHLRSDEIRKRLLGAKPETRLPADAYRPDVTQRVYRHIEGQAAIALAAGRTVVADAVYAAPAERLALEAVAKRAKVPFAGLWLEAPQRIAAERIEVRKSDASDATPAVLEAQIMLDTGAIGWSRIEAGGEPDQSADAAADVLAAAGFKPDDWSDGSR
ncbi:MAG: AAA family ATPase [Proteobacteria bacterium]|nr:AAA family ATPase [Pseudomonadota bacterium]